MALPMAHFAALHAAGQRMNSTITQLHSAPMRTVSTVPANGDVNPYGVAFVPSEFPTGGKLAAGDLLVSNFNNSGNLQGTGMTIVRINSDNQQSVFFQGPIGPMSMPENLGLTTALGVLKAGYVVVGSVPSTNGMADTLGQSRLLVLDKNGNLVQDFPDMNLIDNRGPWDLTINDMGSSAQIFVSNVLTGTVDRFNVDMAHGFTLSSPTQIASGYKHGPDPNAFELGPTGLAYDAAHDTLYVASTADNAIFAIPSASTTTDHGTGTIVYSDRIHLHGPLGLTFAPDGNLIAAQGDAVNPKLSKSSELVEFTPDGKFVGEFSVSKRNPGGAFGVASAPGSPAQFAAVNDIDNTVEVWQIAT
jgi:hypothetical protein